MSASIVKKYYILIVYPAYDKNVNYYQEFWKTYLINELYLNDSTMQKNENHTMQRFVSTLEVILTMQYLETS